MPRILIVEDDADSRLALSVRLRAAGFEVLTAGDGATATSIARQQKPDLIVLDLGLPAGDGFVIMERLRGIATTAAVPVIVLTGRDAAYEIRARKAGAAAFFQKPADNDALLAAIHAHLPAEQAQAAPTRVLLVEDDADTRQAMVIRLRHQGFDVVTASDAATALSTTAREKPDVILLDLGLPGGGGLAVLDRLRNNATLAGIPVIVLTGRVDEQVKAQALGAGARAFLAKSTPPDTLLATIRQTVSGSRG